MRLVILFVEYDNGNRADSFRLFRSITDKIDCNKTYYIIDNLNEGNYVTPVTANIYRMGGDNSNWEFSAWQKCLNFLRKENVPYDAALLSNDAFMAYGWNFIEKNASVELIRRAIANRSVIGHIDTKGYPMNAMGYDVSNWICTNCFIMPREIIDGMGTIVSVNNEKMDQIIDSRYEERLLLEKKITTADLENGCFELKANLDVAITTCRIEADKSFTSAADGRELCVLIHNISVGGISFEKAPIRSGLYEKEGISRWMKRTALIEYNSDVKGAFIIKGFIPMDIMSHNYNGEMSVKVFATTPVFKKEAPIGNSYKQMAINWFTDEWHSKLPINGKNWNLYRNKVKAMLNESLLSARVRDNGFSVQSYKEKEISTTGSVKKIANFLNHLLKK